MGYWLLRDNCREYAVDWDVVYRIIRSFHFGRYRASGYTLESTDDGFGMPLMHHYVFDWDTIRRKAIASADEDFARISERATVYMRDAQEELRWMVESTQRLNEHFTNLMRVQQEQNLGRMQTVTSRWELATDALRVVRDLSADFIVVSSGLMTGGAATAGIAALGAGSALKGVYKYQDTESVASSLMTASGSLLFGALKIRAAGVDFSTGEKLLILVGQGAVDAASAWASGKSGWDIVKAGTAKAVTGGIAEFGLSPLFKSEFVTKRLSNAALKVSIEYTAGMKGPAEKTSVKLMQGVLKKGNEKPVKVATETLLQFGKDVVAPPSEKEQVRRNDSLLASATLQDDLLLSLSIIDMEEGIAWPRNSRSRYRTTGR